MGHAHDADDQELIVDLILSLDGCAAAEGWPGWWGLQSPEYLAWLDEQPEHIAVMGANTFRLMSAMAREAPELDIEDEEKASFAQMAAQPKIVLSSTLEEPLEWGDARLVRTRPVDAAGRADGAAGDAAGDAETAAEAIFRLKAESDRPLVLVGSLSLGRSLMASGVVDRFRIVLFPVITGRTGLERIWEGYTDLSLELLDSRTFGGGLQLLEYRPTPLEHPPGTGWDRRRD